MKIGFFLALRHDTSHFLHAASLTREAAQRMPGVEVVQLTDEMTPMVPGVASVERLPKRDSLLDLRLEHYANCIGDWLLVDTDVSIRADVRGVFADHVFDVALVDRDWPHLQDESMRLSMTMPFNTGVTFHRFNAFWQDVLAFWRAQPQAYRDNWMSEQMAVYSIVKTGRYRVKVLPGSAYNWPPLAGAPVPDYAAMVHFKGPRKKDLTPHAMQVLSGY